MPSRALNIEEHKLLDLSSVKELPDSHAWTSQVDGVDGGPESVPVIDLSKDGATELIGHACKTWGVFQAINHGVPQSLLREIEVAGKGLFALPMHQKLRAARVGDAISGYGVARISSFFSKLMWSEGFTIFGSPADHARQLWPHDYQRFCNIVEEYNSAMNKLAGRVMRLMVGSLGVSEGEVEWGAEGGCAGLQLNWYPSCPDPERAMGLAAHTDSTIVTILHQSNTSGLQVRREGERWTRVPPQAGALVIHVGDLMHILSNGEYPSVVHRAVVNRTQPRLSIAYLYGPPSSVKISPLPKLVDNFHPPLYRPITWKEYLGTKAKHFNNALTAVRVG